MSAGRIALVAAGLLIAVVVIALIVWSFRGAETSAAASEPAQAAQAAGNAAGGRAQEPPPPKWQSFLRPDERATPPRPVVRLAQRAPNPFDRFAAGVARAVVRPENPGFRLEGIAGGARAVALISGHAVREGGEISGYRVVRIGRSAVTLAGPQGARLDLALGDGR